MKYMLFTVLFSLLISIDFLKASSSEDDSASNSHTSARRNVSSEEIDEHTIDVSQEDKNTTAHKEIKEIEDFEDTYFSKMGKVFFIVQRLSRFTKFGAMTFATGLSAVAIWNDQEITTSSDDDSGPDTDASIRSTGFNSTIFILNFIAIISASADVYATNFLNEAEKRKEGD